MTGSQLLQGIAYRIYQDATQSKHSNLLTHNAKTLASLNKSNVVFLKNYALRLTRETQ